VVGIVFLMHGIQKLFSMGVPAVVAFLGSTGMPFPRFFGVLLPLIELFGGVALILGLATRATALIIAVEMVVAIVKVHLKNGFFMPPGYEFALTLLAASVCLLLTGAGAASVDGALWGKKKEAPAAAPAKV
jgi:putative oxidoreductase